MIAGTSTVSTATWQHSRSSSPHQTSSDLLSPSPTVFSSINHLQPRVTSAPTCCAPNEVVIHLSTTLVIPNYNSFYAQTPIEAFRPTFYPLPDGSLMTKPFIDDLMNANISLLVTGMLTMLFVRNLFVSGDYIRRGKVKNKTLFYLLFLSQVLAPASLVPVIMSYFNQFLSCTV